MISDTCCVSAVLPSVPSPSATTERWLRVAEADYCLCREFSLRYGARLGRSLRSQRVGWELYGHSHFALLLPDAARLGCLTDDEWYLYYVSGESLFRRTSAQCQESGMIVLAESADDWAQLLRQSLQEQIFDVRYTVTPDYLNPSGETEQTASGFIFVLEAYAPSAIRAAGVRIAGAGNTPEEAARDACRQWLQAQSPVAGHAL